MLAYLLADNGTSSVCREHSRSILAYRLEKALVSVTGGLIKSQKANS